MILGKIIQEFHFTSIPRLIVHHLPTRDDFIVCLDVALTGQRNYPGALCTTPRLIM
jgi:hypothetical protein